MLSCIYVCCKYNLTRYQLVKYSLIIAAYSQDVTFAFLITISVENFHFSDSVSVIRNNFQEFRYKKTEIISDSEWLLKAVGFYITVIKF